MVAPTFLHRRLLTTVSAEVDTLLEVIAEL